MEKFLRIVGFSGEDYLIPINDILSVGVASSLTVIFLSGSLYDVTAAGEVPVITLTTNTGPNAGLNAVHIMDQIDAALQTSWHNPVYTIDIADFPAGVTANARSQNAWTQ